MNCRRASADGQSEQNVSGLSQNKQNNQSSAELSAKAIWDFV